MRTSIQHKAWMTLIYAFLIIMVVISLFPVVYVLLASFKTNQEIMVGGVNLLPQNGWRFQNYAKAWREAEFARYTFNSVYMCTFIVAGSIIAASIQGYVFSRGTSKFTKFVYAQVMASLFISIGALSLYPQLSLAKRVHLNGTLWGVIIIYVFGMNVTQVFLSTSFFNQIPKEIDEAARIDGCSFARIFRSIIFPLTKPLVATIGLISFRSSWSDYLLPYVFTISKKSLHPLVVGVVNLRSTGAGASQWDMMLAGISISLIPMLVVYLFLNQFFITGLTEGAIKG
jgi:multiple sugar transport system permease protein